MNNLNAGKWVGVSAAILALAALAACGNNGETADDSTAADDYPSGPVTLVLPSAPGAPIDALGRELAAALEPELGESVVVSNRDGGSGIVAMSYAQQQPADGQTITLEATGITSVLQLQDVPFTIDAFEPVARMELDPFALFVKADSPYQTLDDFLKAAEQNPGRLSGGGYGTGSPHHIRAAQLSDAAGAEYQWVAYDSGSNAITDLLGNNIDAVMSNASQIARFGDEIRTLAHSSEEPLPQAPDVPSFADEGYEGLTGYHWRGALVKSGTPEPIVEELHNAINAAVASEDFQAYLENVGNLDGTMPREEFVELIESQEADDLEALKSIGLVD